MKIHIIFAIGIILMLGNVKGISIHSINSGNFYPGKEGKIFLELENDLDRDITDISLKLDFSNSPFIPIGVSEKTLDELKEDNEKDFTFKMKASNDISPGDYKIPYILTYEDRGVEKSREGELGVIVNANALLSYFVETEKPVVGEKGTINLNIVNKGFADAKFVSIKIHPDPSYELLSEKEVYIGKIDSDDFETVSFDVIFKNKNSIFSAEIEYRDFNNTLIEESINFPIKVYTKEEALKLKIIKKGNIPIIISSIITLILMWVLINMIRKRNKMKI